MQSQKLGRLEPVDPREVWKNGEAAGFTPWLAREENLVLLSDTIGLELELEAQEKNVGPFRADILCRDTGSNTWVLIENQLAKTDHSHLGQLLTYAAGLKAVTIVWIADRFTDEHRAALDWLNDVTAEEINFFGLEVELWRIGESPAAPKFNVVSSPNDWTKAISSAAEGEVTETKALQQEYWAALRELLIDRKGPLRPQKPRPQHWTNFAVGRAYFGIHASVNSQAGFIEVGVDCLGPDAKPHFYLLQQEKEEIEKEVGYALDWEELPNRKQSRVSVRKNGVDPNDKANWPAQHEWLADKLEGIYRAFSPRIKELNAADLAPPEDADA